ncbi:MAG TPA: carboxypeptidase-like regulatory domain-containing protein [Vicinamibacterales bacterium]|nr:carboxypeptidase-like regulatory domain-containing protein [Vicinamibacterales bacterium]
MKSVGRCAALAAIVLLSAPAAPSAQMRGLGRIKGTVNDDTGAPLKGVAVRATLSGYDGAIEEMSDDKGAWAIAGMARGEWHLAFYAPGYTPTGAKVLLAAELSNVPPIAIVLKKAAK